MNCDNFVYRDKINNEMIRYMIDFMKDLSGFGIICMKGVNYGYVFGFLIRIFYINNFVEKLNVGVMLLDFF